MNRLDLWTSLDFYHFFPLSKIEIERFVFKIYVRLLKIVDKCLFFWTGMLWDKEQILGLIRILGRRETGIFSKS